MMTTNDSRTAAEIAYDAARLSPQPAEHSPLFNDLKAWIDATFDAEQAAAPPQLDHALAATDPLRAAARYLDDLTRQHARTVRVEPTYRDVAGDYTDEPGGPIAYIDYSIGAGDDTVILSIGVEAAHQPPEVLWGKHDSIPLVDAEQAAVNLLRLLGTPEVVAALADDAERRGVEPADDDEAEDDGEKQSDAAQYDDPPPIPWRTPA